MLCQTQHAVLRNPDVVHSEKKIFVFKMGYVPVPEVTSEQRMKWKGRAEALNYDSGGRADVKRGF